MRACTWAVLAAAGQGTRMGLGINKAFAPLVGRPVLMRTLDALISTGLFDGAVIVTRQEDIPQLRELVSQLEFPITVVSGGDTRQKSVYNGLCALPENCEYVAVHDAARPFITYDIVKATLDSAEQTGSGIACTPATDTIKSVDGEGNVLTLDRGSLRAVQTPQTFRMELLRRAHEWAITNNVNATDDSALVELMGEKVSLVSVKGGRANIKLTTPEDMIQAERVLTRGMRAGYGYDAHRLVEGRKLVLCGVEIPYEKGLLGHSDADVATHALIDALLGAAGLGDIGGHFPDSDARYKDICSLRLLEETALLLRSKRFVISNCDITIVAQRPKIAPYISQMRQIIAETLGIACDCVNIKGKTTEGMGFEGRGEGISASCVAMTIEYI